MFNSGKLLSSFRTTGSLSWSRKAALHKWDFMGDARQHDRDHIESLRAKSWAKDFKRDGGTADCRRCWILL